MIAILNLLDMNAGPAGTDIDAPRVAGKAQTILETASKVDVVYEDLGKRPADARGGFFGYGTAESKFLRTIHLKFSNVPQGTLTWIDIHYRAFVSGGSLPFDCALPQTTDSFNVVYQRAPILSHVGRQGGNNASVSLQEVPLTD